MPLNKAEKFEIAAGDPVFIADLTPEQIRAMFQDPNPARYLHSLGFEPSTIDPSVTVVVNYPKKNDPQRQNFLVEALQYTSVITVRVPHDANRLLKNLLEGKERTFVLPTLEITLRPQDEIGYGHFDLGTDPDLLTQFITGGDALVNYLNAFPKVAHTGTNPGDVAALQFPRHDEVRYIYHWSPDPPPATMAVVSTCNKLSGYYPAGSNLLYVDTIWYSKWSG